MTDNQTTKGQVRPVVFKVLFVHFHKSELFGPHTCSSTQETTKSNGNQES